MNHSRRVIWLAVTAAWSLPVMAQSTVSVSGQIKGNLEAVSAGGSSYVFNGGGGSMAATSRMRVTDQTTEIRFAGEEKLEGGLSAYWQVASDVRMDAGTGTLGSRNTGIGLRHKELGSLLIGRWDLHYNVHQSDIDAAGATSNDLPQQTSYLSLMHGLQVGTANVTGAPAVQALASVGGRQNNVILYQSPNWSGFSFTAGYGYGTEANTPSLAGKDGVWAFSPKYVSGPLAVVYSHMDAKYQTSTLVGYSMGAGGASLGTGTVSSGVGTVGAAAAYGNRGYRLRSDRLGVAYKVATGGGSLKLGFLWDESKASDEASGLSLGKRTVWALPLSFDVGNHAFYFTHARAGNVAQSTGAGGSNQTLSSSGARFNMLAYSYALSKRTRVNVSWAKISNETNAMYDLYSRGVGNVALGSDPQMISLGIRHAF